MKVLGAKVKEQGVTFGIIAVKPEVLHNEARAAELQRFGISIMGMIPIILMAQNSRGIPTCYGRKDIVRFLSKVPFHAIPWREYTVA